MIDDKKINHVITETKGVKFCYHIKLKNGDNLYLTEYDKAIMFDNKLFIPNSGITLVSGEFNDSAKNYIILKGIFEKNGVENYHDLTNSIITVYIYSNHEINHFVTYNCSLYTKRDLDFTIYLEPATLGYNQSLLQPFSKTCRANFGDKKCKVNKVAYSKIYDIVEIMGRSLSIVELNQEDGYFNHGEITFNNNSFHSKITSHIGNIITVERAVPDSLKNTKIGRITTGCDKNFITCCNKFNNAVNFRGEPFIPTDDFIKT